MKRNNTVLLCLLWMCFCPALHSQVQDTIAYRYDAAGNRISRTLVLSTISAGSAGGKASGCIYRGIRGYSVENSKNYQNTLNVGYVDNIFDIVIKNS